MNGNKVRAAVIAGTQRTSRSIAGQLETLLGAVIHFSPYSLEEWLNSDIKMDIVLVNSRAMTHRVAQKVKTETEIIVVRRTLLRSSWGKIRTIPPQTRLMLVNGDRESAEEAIILLYELGARHLDLVPVYPDLNEIPHIESAITPGEVELVPHFVKNIIDISDRVIDVSTMIDLLGRCGLLNAEMRSVLAAYSEQIIPISQGLQMTMQELLDNKNLLQKTLDLIQNGVVVYDKDGVVTLCNQPAENIFGLQGWEIAGQTVDNLLKGGGARLDLQNEEIRDEFIQIGKRNIIVNKSNIKNEGEILGGVLVLQEATRAEDLELKLRSELRAKGLKARYSFRDIIFKSEKMEQAVSRARRIANSDLNVLILGGSGTGKEMFAHAIHNSSPRSRFPFVAVNCNALPENLLESELFGYEEGAFTGAKRGGKPGLFELAHRGTIFLDEIGDFLPGLQGRLLRVIQEKEILKVGGTKVLPVDVRVIAATNRNLVRMVNEGQFRTDLYYRLKVLQLEVPLLRERKEDIPFLVSYFVGRRNFKGTVTNEAMQLLTEYSWPGNVRELENTVDSLTVMCTANIELKDILLIIGEASLPEGSEKYGRSGGGLIGKPGECLGAEAESIVLEEIYLARVHGRRIGRRSLVALARARGLLMTESEVRQIIDNLRRSGFIDVSQGRSGCRLTDMGYKHFTARPAGDGK